MRKATVSFVKEDASGLMGLHFKHSVHTLMKNISYDTEIIVTSQDILISKCTYKAGANEDQRIFCVHNLFPLYQLSLILMGGYMVQHVLIEFTSRWGNRKDNELRTPLIERLKEALIRMIGEP